MKNKKIVTNVIVFFQYSIYLTNLKIFALEDFYENSMKPANETNMFVGKRTSKPNS